jgi:hypothetical protein
MTRIEGFAVHSTGARRRTLRVFLLSLAVTALAKGAAFLPGYSIDDYYLVLQEKPLPSALSQGRFGQDALVRLFRLLELDSQSGRVFFVAFAILVSSLLATSIVRYWNLAAAGWLPVAAAAIISIHPFTTEVFTFRAALGIIMCSLALLVPLLALRRWSPAGVAAGACLFAFTLSVYQMVLQYCVMIVLMDAAIGLSRVLVVGSASRWPPRVASLLSWRRLARHRNTALLACAALGTAAYMLVNAVARRLLHVALGKRFGLLSRHETGERARAVWNVLSYRFLAPSPLLSQFAKGLLLLLLLAALVGLAVRARPWLLQRRSVLLLPAVAALLAVAAVWTVGIVMVPQTFWPVPRVMSHVGVFWAGTLAIAYRCAGTRIRWALALLSLLIVLAFIGSSGRILDDQLRLNARDAAKASRILARLEALPGFTGTEPVAVNGTSPDFPLRFRTHDMDMNLSAFSADWAKLAILREISGYDLKPAEDQAQKAAAAAYCREVGPWPGPQSVIIRDRLAIICLGPG